MITFGAPAVFDQYTANAFDRMIGKENGFAIIHATAVYERQSIKGRDKVPLLTSNKFMPYTHMRIKFPLTVTLIARNKNDFQIIKNKFLNGILGVHLFCEEALRQYESNHLNIELDFQEQLRLSSSRMKKDVGIKKVLRMPSRLFLGAIEKGPQR